MFWGETAVGCWELLGTRWRITTCSFWVPASADKMVKRTRPSL